MYAERSYLWVDPVGLGEPGVDPIVLRYPDGSTARGQRAFIAGLSELVYWPQGYPDGKHVALETCADVMLDEDVVELAYAAARLRHAVNLATDRLERTGAITVAEELREAAVLAGYPPSDRNPLAG